MDKKTSERLEKEPYIKVYRTMQLIDGKLYPSMSAMEDNILREPTTLGEWERSKENLSLRKENGKTDLNKGNKSKTEANYNPYFHTSNILLNDQFASAQDRDNLVVVECLIPYNEVVGREKYHAEGANDSIGKKEWKAGPLQGLMSGTRNVYLTRYDKPIRILPIEEVAQKIEQILPDKTTPLPTNCFWPKLQNEMKNLGYNFVETNNKYYIKKGENKGKTWTSIYGKDFSDKYLNEKNNDYYEKLGLMFDKYAEENSNLYKNKSIETIQKYLNKINNEYVKINTLGNNYIIEFPKTVNLDEKTFLLDEKNGSEFLLKLSKKINNLQDLYSDMYGEHEECAYHGIDIQLKDIKGINFNAKKFDDAMEKISQEKEQLTKTFNNIKKYFIGDITENNIEIEKYFWATTGRERDIITYSKNNCGVKDCEKYTFEQAKRLLKNNFYSESNAEYFLKSLQESPYNDFSVYANNARPLLNKDETTFEKLVKLEAEKIKFNNEYNENGIEYSKEKENEIIDTLSKLTYKDYLQEYEFGCLDTKKIIGKDFFNDKRCWEYLDETLKSDFWYHNIKKDESEYIYILPKYFTINKTELKQHHLSYEGKYNFKNSGIKKIISGKIDDLMSFKEFRFETFEPNCLYKIGEFNPFDIKKIDKNNKRYQLEEQKDFLEKSFNILKSSLSANNKTATIETKLNLNITESQKNMIIETCEKESKNINENQKENNKSHKGTRS